MKTSLNAQILFGALTGILLGAILNIIGPESSFYAPTLYACQIVGGIFRVNPNLSKAFIANRVNEFVEKILE